MAVLRFLVFVALIAASVDGIRDKHRRRRKAETAEDPHFENELRRVKRLGEGPYLNRVKRLRRSVVPMNADVDEGKFDPGLSRVKRHRRSPNPIMTMHKRYGKALARMKRVPYFREEFDSLRRKRNTFRHNFRRQQHKQGIQRHKNLMNMKARLTRVQQRKHHSPLNLKNNKRFQKTQNAHRNHRIHHLDDFRHGGKHRGKIGMHRLKVENKNAENQKLHRPGFEGEEKRRISKRL